MVAVFVALLLTASRLWFPVVFPRVLFVSPCFSDLIYSNAICVWARFGLQAVYLVEDTIVHAIKQHQLRGDLMVPEGMGNTKSVGFIYRLVDPVQANSTQEVGQRIAASFATNWRTYSRGK